jgi:RNA polymerase sigma factor for flagellar operon FliA
MTPSLQLSPPASLAETLSVVDVVLASVARHVPPHVSREDLASAGKVALVEALLRFDGSPAETRAYCYVCVRGAVLDELRRLDPLSRHTRAQVTLVRRAAVALERQLGRAPTQGEIATATGLASESLDQLARLANAAEPCSVDEIDRDGELVHVLTDADATCPARSAESGDTNASIQAALDRLAPNHAFVLRRYYLDEATLDDIAGELSVSKERVRQIREAAEKKLREDFVVLALWQTVLTRR